MLSEALLRFFFSSVWLYTLQDIAPLIGIIVLLIVIIIIAIILVKWYEFWVNRGMKEHERKYRKVRLSR